MPNDGSAEIWRRKFACWLEIALAVCKLCARHPSRVLVVWTRSGFSYRVHSQDSQIWTTRSQQVDVASHPVPRCNCQVPARRPLDSFQFALSWTNTKRGYFGEYWLSVRALASVCVSACAVEGKEEEDGSQWDTDQSWLLSRLQVIICRFSLLLHGTMNSSAGAGNYRRGSAKGDKVIIARAQTCLFFALNCHSSVQHRRLLKCFFWGVLMMRTRVFFFSKWDAAASGFIVLQSALFRPASCVRNNTF